MTKRTSIFIKCLCGAIVLSMIISVAERGSKAAAGPILLFIIGYVGWRILIFTRALLRPLKGAAPEPVKEAIDKLGAHVDQSMRDAGFSKVADQAKRAGATIGEIETAVGKRMDAAEAHYKNN